MNPQKALFEAPDSFLQVVLPEHHCLVCHLLGVNSVLVVPVLRKRFSAVEDAFSCSCCVGTRLAAFKINFKIRFSVVLCLAESCSRLGV